MAEGLMRKYGKKPSHSRQAGKPQAIERLEEILETAAPNDARISASDCHPSGCPSFKARHSTRERLAQTRDHRHPDA
jgi:hypothetical protein